MPNAHRFAGKRKKSKIAVIALLAIAAASSCRAAAQQANTATLAPDYRLEIIGFKLATSNPALCDKADMLTGMMLHDEGGFSENVRDRAKARYALEFGFGVVQVVPGSPAAAVGLQRGDEIVAINGVSMSSFARNLVKRGASYDRTQRFLNTLDAQLRQGPALLVVERDGAEREVSLTGAPGCGGHQVLIDSNELNAWSDGTYVAVTSRMVGFADSDDELAFVVAHEMAHNILKHSKKFGLGKQILAEFGIGSNKLRKAELAADALAIEIMAAAGYDLNAPEMLLRRSARHNPLNLSLSHPGANRRIAATQNTRGRIAVRRAYWKTQPGLVDGQVASTDALSGAATPLPAGGSDRIVVVARLDRQPFAAPFVKQSILPLADTTAPTWPSHHGSMPAPVWQPTPGALYGKPQSSWLRLADREIRK